MTLQNIFCATIVGLSFVLIMTQRVKLQARKATKGSCVNLCWVLLTISLIEQIEGNC